MIKGKQFLIPLFISLTFFLQSQEEYIYTVTDYNTENGLAGRFANYTHKDSGGLIWIGTQNGLHRFDGRDFKVFDEAFGLPFNQVMEIYEDNEGWLWLYRSCLGKDKDYCYKNLAFFHPKTYEIKTFEERFGINPPFSPADIEFITTSPAYQYLVVGTSNKTFILGTDSQLQILPFFNNRTKYELFAVLDDGKMGTVQKTEEELRFCLLAPDGKELKSENLKNVEEISKYRWNQYRNGTILLKGNQRHYLNQSGELVPYHLAQFLPPQYIPPGNRHTFFDETTKSFWLAGRGGIRVINPEKRRFFGFRNEDLAWILDGFFAVSDQEVFYINGVYNYVNHSNEIIGNNGQIGSLFPKISKSDLKTTPALFPLRTRFAIQQPSDKSAMQNVGRSFNQKFKNIHDCIRTDNVFWLGTENGLWAYNTENESLNFFKNYNEFTDFKDSYIHHIQPRTENEYWISTNKGLFHWHIHKGILAQYARNAKGKNFIPTDNIYHFHQPKDGTLWLAGRDGLIHLSLNEYMLFENGQHYELFTKHNGLLSDICVAVYEDEFGFLWVATDKGLAQFDLATSDIKVYTTKDGLAINYFREYNHLQTPTGELIFGGIDGIVSFHPKDFKEENVSEPNVPLIIVEYERYNPEEQKFEIATSKLLNEEKIVLQPGIRLFNLRVCLEDYRNAKEQMFAYRIQGYQDEWQEDKSNLIRISGLPYGNHNLEIKGKLPDGRFSNQILNIPIEVLRPIYLEWWFFVLMGFVLLGSGVFWLKNRTHTLQQRQKELKKQVAERTAVIVAQTEELRSLDKMKSRFFANISHELRTPLTLILAPIQNILKRNQLNNRDYTELLLVRKNTQTLRKLVNQILDLTKLESGKLSLHPSEVNWYHFLRTIIANFESLADTKDIRFQFEYDGEEDLKTEIDKEKTEIILHNLLSNSFKFTPPGGEILLTAKNTAKFLKITVKDTGRGIHPDDLPHIFDRFFQTQNKNVAAEGGTGIGLALSQEFIRLMNGKISVESEWGKGSCFKVEFPRKEIIPQSKITENPSEEKSPADLIKPDELILTGLHNQNARSVNRPTILLVEDNHDLRLFIQSVLSEKYNVIAAENGKAALKWLTEHDRTDRQPSTVNRPPSLIVSDLMMPVMDGYQLLNAVKIDPNYNHIPIIILTARAGTDDRLKALRIGVDDYLTKPFNSEELMVRIENLLNNAAARQLAFTGNNEINQDSSEQKPDVKSAKIPLEIDTEWLEKLETVMLVKLDNVNLVIDDIADEMNLSRRQFYRRIKENTGLTANQYLKTLRLNQARTFLENKKYDSVKAIAYAVGFKDVVYFSRQFKKEFGKLPSEYEVE